MDSASFEDALLGASVTMTVVSIVISFAATIYLIIVRWKLFVKAGEAGWKSLIPFYSGYVLYKVVYGAGWKYFLTYVPVLGLIFEIAVAVRMAYCFGKDTAFGVLNVFFTPIMEGILAFGKAEYQGPETEKFF